MSRPNPENRPNFYQPLLEMDRQITETSQRVRNGLFRVRQINGKDYEDLDNTLQDLNATMIEAKQLITKARSLEKKARTRP